MGEIFLVDFAVRNFTCTVSHREQSSPSPAWEALSRAWLWPLVPRGTRRHRLVTARLG